VNLQQPPSLASWQQIETLIMQHMMGSAGEPEKPADELSRLTVLVSNSATSVACVVDAVVKEAVLYFATMPTMSAQATSTSSQEEVFKMYGKKAYFDACAATEAREEMQQLVAERNPSAVVSAGRVAMSAARTASTAREAAQLCMGILEEAVQANAGLLARETAKRCAEQALRSVEAATEAENNSMQLALFLAPDAPEQVLQHGIQQSPVKPQSGEDFSTFEGHPPVFSSIGRRQPVPLNDACRWWEQEEVQRCILEMPSINLPQLGSSPSAVSAVAVSAAFESIGHLEAHFEKKVECCLQAASNIQLDGDRKDEQALKVIVEWRYGQASAKGIAEEDVISDAAVARLAYWRPEPGENPVNNQILQEVQQHGPVAFKALVVALSNLTPSPTQGRGAAFKGAGGPRAAARKGNATPTEWDKLFHDLGWGLQVPIQRRNTDFKRRSRPSLDVTLDDLTVPTEESWSIDDMTLQHLHVMSIHSRFKQRNAAGAKQKEPGGTTSSGSTAPVNAQPTAAAEEDEMALKEFLKNTLGTWELAAPAGANMPYGSQRDAGAQQSAKRAPKKKPKQNARGPNQNAGFIGNGYKIPGPEHDSHNIAAWMNSVSSKGAGANMPYVNKRDAGMPHNPFYGQQFPQWPPGQLQPSPHPGLRFPYGAQVPAACHPGQNFSEGRRGEDFPLMSLYVPDMRRQSLQ
jgi:hypothetical protein